jgi:hypothetical protein
MANWVECTVPSGDKVLVNFDNATSLHRNIHTGTTQVDFIGEGKMLVIKESVDELKAQGLTV